MKERQSSDALGAGIILIGFGVLMLFRGVVPVFPWILAIIGLASLPAALRRDRGWGAWQAFYWLVGLAVLFATETFWPGILILLGGSMLLRALSPGVQGAEPEERIAQEPVTIVPLEPANLSMVQEAAAVEPDDHGTSPLSPEDVDLLEAELVAAVESEAEASLAAADIATAPRSDQSQGPNINGDQHNLDDDQNEPDTDQQGQETGTEIA